MLYPYETVYFDGEWKASTFGCSCCSGTEEPDDQIAAMTATKNMYQALADRYERMIAMAKHYDIALAYEIFRANKEAQRNLAAAHEWENNPKQCGTWHKRMFDVGFEALEEEAAKADMSLKLHPETEAIAEAFCW